MPRTTAAAIDPAYIGARITLSEAIDLMTNNEQEHQFGKYILQGELGRGGFATVYKAHDTVLRRDVALKLLHPQLLTDPAFVTRFENDARATAQLDHPRIATIYELGHHDGRMFMAIQLLSGGSLADRIKTQGRLTFSEAARVVDDIAQALDYAHAAGFTHRDVKPSNILLNRRGDAILTDFGLVKAAESSVIARTTMGGLIGTPAYIAPEIWEGLSEGAGADVYALGCVLFEILTGELLFTGTTPPAVMLKHFQPHRYPDHWPDDTPAAIEAVLERALARDPAARYASAGALAADLRAMAQRIADPLVEPYAALEAALAAHEWNHAATLAQEITARDAGYRNIRALADQAAAGQRQAALARQVAQWRDTALAAERNGQPDAAHAAARQWLERAPADAEAQALLQRLEAEQTRQVVREHTDTGDSQAASQNEQHAPSDQEGAQARSDQDTLVTPNFRSFIALTTIGLALGFVVAQFTGQSWHLATPVSSALGATIGAFIIALALQRVVFLGARGFVVIVAGWAVSAAISGWLDNAHINSYINAMIAGAIGGLATISAVQAKVSLRDNQILLVSAGWALGFMVGVLIAANIGSQIGSGSNAVDLALAALGGAIAGAIGSAVMAWQIARARRQAR
jgi:tRNA A-37 threonylcarbamoyl transferase component Bud32